MTTGQRIAAKRKELKLSQEALGEQLSVSRQSIYKWESDSSLPEIDKLVAMSRLFSVNVGWLLGVEKEPPSPEAEVPKPESTATESQNGELTEQQLNMVEEIVARYIAAQPKPKKQKKWPYVLAALILCGVGSNLFQRLDQLDNRYNNLQNSIGNVSSNVNSQINSITNRVEEVLKSQNNLTADYGTKYTGADLASNTITFELHATPKTYVPGMEVHFLADCGSGNTAEVSAQEDGNHKFSGQLTCPLTDNITLSAVFMTGDTHQTQLLDNYSGLYGASLPEMNLQGFETSYIHVETSKNGQFHLPTAHGWFRKTDSDTKFGDVQLESCRVGLFLNGELLNWLDCVPTPDNWDIDTDMIYQMPEMDISLKTGDILHFAAIFTDEYGRQGVSPCVPAFECFGDEISWMRSSDATPYFQLETYKF